MPETCTRCGRDAKYSIILSTYSASASGQRQVRFCAECYADHRAWLPGDQDLLRDVVRHRDELMRERDEALEEVATLRLALGTLPDAQVLSPLSMRPVDASAGQPAPMLICPSCQCAWPGLIPGSDDTVTCICGRLLGCASRVR